MTLIQTVTTDDLVIQVADRRLSRPDGSVFDDDYTKLVCWNTSFTVGFTGLARIDPAQKKSTSEWLAETLCDYASFEDGVDALRYWASGQIGQLPTGKGWEDKRLGIIIAGFDRRRIPLVAEISNFDPEAPIPANQNEFKCYRIRRAPGHSASFRITGAALTEKMYANILLRRVPRMLKQQDGITRAARLMVALQRRISEDNPGVGRHAMAVAIPRERTMPEVLSNLDAPSLNTMNSTTSTTPGSITSSLDRTWPVVVGRGQTSLPKRTLAIRTCRKSVDVFSSVPNLLRKLNRPVVDIRMRQNARKRKSSAILSIRPRLLA